MNAEELSRKLREMVGAGVCVAAGRGLAMPLTVHERKSLGIVSKDRIREFASGRVYAKRALSMLGINNVDLLIGPDRSPVWPTGIVGSITHVRCGDDGVYAAAVARTDVVLAVGVDFEMEGSLDPHVWPHVLTQRELERILALPVGIRRREAQYIWGAKEATAKAVKQRFDPSGLEIDRDPNSGDFIVDFFDNNRCGLLAGVLGHTACLERLIVATVVVPRPGELPAPAKAARRRQATRQ
jgi:4'-phosphopantetheinyl transferase-like protein/4'-phosphopantetheinyl transferase superfamily protein